MGEKDRLRLRSRGISCLGCTPTPFFLMVKPDFQGRGQRLIWLNTVLKVFAAPEPKDCGNRKMDGDAKARCQTSTVRMTEAAPSAFYANASAVLLPGLKKDWTQSAVGPQRSAALNKLVKGDDVRFVFTIKRPEQVRLRALFHIWPKHTLFLISSLIC